MIARVSRQPLAVLGENMVPTNTLYHVLALVRSIMLNCLSYCWAVGSLQKTSQLTNLWKTRTNQLNKNMICCKPPTSTPSPVPPCPPQGKRGRLNEVMQMPLVFPELDSDIHDSIVA